MGLSDPGSEDPNMPRLTLTKQFEHKWHTSASNPLQRTSTLAGRGEKKNGEKRWGRKHNTEMVDWMLLSAICSALQIVQYTGMHIINH